MNFFELLKTKNKKLKYTLLFGLRTCLILALIATLVLSFYRATYTLFQYFLGLTLLRMSIFFFVVFVVCYLAFIRITKDLE